jgi:hypothetical protein
MADDNDVNVPIKARTHELNQLQEMLPAARNIIADDETAEEVDRIYREHIDGLTPDYADAEYSTFATYVSMPADDWQRTIRHLNHLRHRERLRVEWLQKKLVRRLRERLAELED